MSWIMTALRLLLLSNFFPTVAAEKDNRTPRQPNLDQSPNFVIVLADDLDWTLGGANASTLSRTRRLVGGEGDDGHGKTFSNWFVQTPVCCPSRAELLTGRLYHNLKVPFSRSQEGCMHVDVKNDPTHPFYDELYFSNFFADLSNEVGSSKNPKDGKPSTSKNSANLSLNYKIGIFGKHLNTHNPTRFLPNGVDEMLINGGGEYLNPTFTYGRRTNRTNNNYRIDGHHYYHDDDVHEVIFNNCTEITGMPCYSTSVIGNTSLAWIRRQVIDDDKKNDGDQEISNPFLALISVKAPHIQDGNGFPMSIPAPWYNQTVIPEHSAPRTPNYNFTGESLHHWLVEKQPPLTDLEANKVDNLYVSRLKTLISVDDLVHDLVSTLEELDVLDNTYIIFTSDNGYRLGQFRMPCCKLHPYENDIRVPMMIRGPGIGVTRRRSISRDGYPPALFSHVHLIPTLLGLATGKHDSQEIIPKTMDGTNLAHWLFDENDDGVTTNQIPEGLKKIEQRRLHLTPTLPSNSSSISAIIEYTSLGNVVRYKHLIDTYNHSFVALRIMPSDPKQSQYETFHSSSSSSSRGSRKKKNHDNHIIETISNLKYVEFRDSRIDWTNKEGPPLERELYDLDKDPYELDNLLSDGYSRISPLFLQALEAKMKRSIACSGDSCRKEHSTGLDFERVVV